MGFSKIDGTQEVFQVFVLDTFGTRIGNWKCNKKDFPKVVRILNDKWGLGMKIGRDSNDTKDLSWIK